MQQKHMMQKPKILWIAVFLVIIVLLVCRYIFNVYTQNEARGFCTQENKFLSEDEMRRRIMINYIKETVERYIETTSYNQELSFYISKYNLKDSESMIKIMQNSKLKKSFEENFGVFAAAYMSEYQYVLYRDANKPKSPQNIYRLVNRHAEVNRRYLDNLSGDYSFIYQWDDGATIVPKSLIRRIDSNTYSVAFFSLDVACCDADYIESNLKDQKSKERYLIKEHNPLIYVEPKINIDDIDGKTIDDIFISKAYDKVILTNADQVRNMYIYENTARLRSLLAGYPMLEKRTVTACGALQPLERKMSAKRIEQDIFKWVRKVHLKLTTSPDW